MGSKSSSSQANTASSYQDYRQVYDAGGGVAGTGNQWDQSVSQIDSSSTNWTQSTADNRQTSNSGNTSWTQSTADNRQTSNSGNTSWTDSANKSQNWSQSTSTADNRQTSNSGNTTWTDSGDKSQNWTDNANRSTTWTDSGDKSQNWTDNANRSTTWTDNSVTTDGRAFELVTQTGLAQTQMAGELARIGSQSNSNAAAAAERAQARALATVEQTNGAAFGLASSSQAAMAKSSADALGFARAANEESLGFVADGFSKIMDMTKGLIGGAQKQADSAASTAQAAYSSAAGQANGNKTLTIAALAAVALVAGVVVFKKA